MADDATKLEAIEEMIGGSQFASDSIAANIAELQEQERQEQEFRARLEREAEDLRRRIKMDREIVSESGDMSVREHVMAVLHESGGPMRVADIISNVEDRGATSQSEKGVGPGVLSVLSKRDDLFQRVSRGTYALKGYRHGRNGQEAEDDED